MTSIPASRSARATTFAPRSWPSSPGFAMMTRTRPAGPALAGGAFAPAWRARGLGFAFAEFTAR